ncbi:MAG: SirB2 family protein [Xanthomonadales bacterium]|nr:SirB2 family protein [Xanthomonadales bacterium]
MSTLAAWYLPILHLHIGCVIASGCVFFMRGTLMLTDSRWTNHKAIKRLSYAIDSTLLIAAIALVLILHQYPFVQAWLTTKVILLVVYIVLGVFALRRGSTRARRAMFFAAALAVYLYIISVAIAHDPGGIFTLLGRA